jgi:hypothetical protein
VTSNPTTKISSVKFLDLDKILIYADSFNVFKNSNVKNILLYNKTLNELIQLDNAINSEIENIVTNCLYEQRNILSLYNSLLNDDSFYRVIEEWNLHSEREDSKFNESIRVNANLKSIEEQLSLTHLLIQKNEFVMFLEKYINEAVKSKCYFKLVDFFVFYFKSNQKEFFNILVSIFRPMHLNNLFRKIKVK